jgi:hypothetical protein
MMMMMMMIASTWVLILAVKFFTAPPVAGFIYIWATLIGNNIGKHIRIYHVHTMINNDRACTCVVIGEQFFAGNFVSMLVVLSILGVFLVGLTNADSISGMLAQRFLIISHFCQLAISVVCWNTSSLAAAVFAIRQQYVHDTHAVLINPLS